VVDEVVHHRPVPLGQPSQAGHIDHDDHFAAELLEIDNGSACNVYQ
jgi:hypothetical protein